MIAETYLQLHQLVRIRNIFDRTNGANSNIYFLENFHRNSSFDRRRSHETIIAREVRANSKEPNRYLQIAPTNTCQISSGVSTTPSGAASTKVCGAKP